MEMLSSDEHSDKQYCVESGLRPIDQIANADEKPSTSWDFYPERRVTQQGGAYTLSLPQSVYSAPILATLNYNGGQCSQLALGVLSGMPCFVSIFLQFTLAVYLHSSLAAASDSCGDAPLLLQRAAVWTFILYVEHDLLETWQMHQWLSQWKTEPHHVKMRLGEVVDTEDRYRPLLVIPLTSVTRMERVVFYLACLLPKLLIAIVCMLAGIGTILRAQTTYDVVLATVAAVFILDVDDIVYKLLVDDVGKKMTGGVPPLSVRWRKERRIRVGCLRRFPTWLVEPLMHVFFFLALTVLLGVVATEYWCGVTGLTVTSR